MNARNAAAIGLILVAFTTLWVYHQIPSHELVWDDWQNFSPDRGWAEKGFEPIRFAFTELRLGHYQPLAWLSFTLDHALHGDDLGSYRWTNLGLHLLNTLLVYFLARRLFGAALESGGSRAVTAALLAAAVFALHPMRVETVAWLTERRHLLAATFALASTLAYLRGIESSRRWLLVSVVAYAASLLSTPLAYGLPLVLVLLDYYPLRRTPSFALRHIKVVEKLPFLLLTAIFTWTAINAQAQSGALIAVNSYSVWQRLAQAGFATVFYPRALFSWFWLPLYERPSRLDPTEWYFLLSILVAIAISGALLAFYRRRPAVATAWFCYLLLLAPVSGFAQSGSQLVADRYSYLATLSLVFLLCGVVSRYRTAALIFALLVIGLWAPLARSQARVWRDDHSLWTHVVHHRPSGIGHNNLAVIARRAGDETEAARQTVQAIRVTPTYGRAWRTAQSLLENEGRRWEPGVAQELSAALESGLATQPSGLARYIAGLAAARAGNVDRAIERFEQAIEIRDDMQAAWLRLGIAYFVSGRREEALAALQRATALAPEDQTAAEWVRRVRDSSPASDADLSDSGDAGD